MGIEVRAFSVTIPAGTGSAGSPHVYDLAMPARTVLGARVRVPPGPRGEVGFALGSAGTAVLPYNAAGYIVTDAEVVAWTTHGQIDSGGWQLIAYNTGQYDHTLQVEFDLDLPGVGGVTLTTPVAITSSAEGPVG